MLVQTGPAEASCSTLTPRPLYVGLYVGADRSLSWGQCSLYLIRFSLILFSPSALDCAPDAELRTTPALCSLELSGAVHTW